MKDKHSIPEQNEADSKPLWQRWAWLVGIWVASVSALAIVAGLLRMFMTAAGMGTP